MRKVFTILSVLGGLATASHAVVGPPTLRPAGDGGDVQYRSTTTVRFDAEAAFHYEPSSNTLQVDKIHWPDGTVQISSPGAGGGGTPGGSDGQVQFNNGGAFGGDSTFLFNNVTNLLTVQEIGVGTYTAINNLIVDQDGDLWMLANASYTASTGRFSRINSNRVAWGLEMQGAGLFPGESDSGWVVWRATGASPGDTEISTTFGAVGGWELGYDVTSNRDLVVGGGALEMDGFGTFPFGRLIHSNLSGTALTGVGRNLYNDLSDHDSDIYPEVFVGFSSDTFIVAHSTPQVNSNLRNLMVVSTGVPALVAIGGVAVNAIYWPDGTVQVSSPSAGGGGITPGATFYIQNTSDLQSGATFYVSSGSVSGKLEIGTRYTTPSFYFDPSGSDATIRLYDTGSPGWGQQFWKSDGTVVGGFSQGSSSFIISVATANTTASIKSRHTIENTGSTLIADHEGTTRLTVSVASTIVNNKLFVSSITPVSQITWADGTIQVSSPPASSGSVGDNLGNHIATKTITASFGISASTISVSTMTIGDLATVNITSSSLFVSTGITTSGNITISTNGTVDRGILIHNNNTSGHPFMRLMTDSNVWSIAISNSDDDALRITTGTILSQNNHLWLSRDGSIGSGGPPTQRLDFRSSESTENTPRHFFRNINSTSGQHRTSLVCALGDNGNDEVCIEAGKNNANARIQQIYGNNELGIGVGGTMYGVISSSSFSMTVPIQVPLGSASAPSITSSASGGTNTGIYWPSADAIAIAIDGSVTATGVTHGFDIKITTAVFNDADSSHYVALKSSASISATNTYVLPPSSGTAGQAITTDGANNLRFSNIDKFKLILDPDRAKLPQANPCVINNSSASNTPFLLCDSSTDESAEWSSVLNPYNSSNGLKADIYYTMASTNTGNIVHNLAIMCVSENDAEDVDANGFGSIMVSTDTVPGTVGYLGVATISFTTDDSCSNNDLFILRYRRDADSSDDTATGDAEIRKILFYEN